MYKSKLGIKFLSLILTLILIMASLSVSTVFADSKQKIFMELGIEDHKVGYATDFSSDSLTLAGMIVEFKSIENKTIRSVVLESDSKITEEGKIQFECDFPSWVLGDTYKVALKRVPSHIEAIWADLAEPTSISSGGCDFVIAPHANEDEYTPEDMLTLGESADNPLKLTLVAKSESLVVKVSNNGSPVQGVKVRMLYGSQDEYATSNDIGYAIFKLNDAYQGNISLSSSTVYDGKTASLVTLPSDIFGMSTCFVGSFTYPDGDGDGTGLVGQQKEGKEAGIFLNTEDKTTYSNDLISKDMPIAVLTDVDTNEEVARLKLKGGNSKDVALYRNALPANYKVTFEGSALTITSKLVDFAIAGASDRREIPITLKTKHALEVKATKDGVVTPYDFSFKGIGKVGYAGTQPYVFNAIGGSEITLINKLDKNKEVKVKISDTKNVTVLDITTGTVTTKDEYPDFRVSPKTGLHALTPVEIISVTLGVLLLAFVLYSLVKRKRERENDSSKDVADADGMPRLIGFYSEGEDEAEEKVKPELVGKPWLVGVYAEGEAIDGIEPKAESEPVEGIEPNVEGNPKD